MPITPRVEAMARAWSEVISRVQGLGRLPSAVCDRTSGLVVVANVLVIEHPYKTLSQVKNLVGRFVRGKRELGDVARARLKELAACG